MSSVEHLRLIPNLDELLRRTSEDETLITRALENHWLQSNTVASDGIEPSAIPAALTSEQQAIKKCVLKALDKLRTHGRNAEFSAEESDGLEALAKIMGRPALFVINNDFPQPLGGQWEILDTFRPKIQHSIQGVGRIEATDEDGNHWFGTGFLAAPDVVMTNRHVAKNFCEQDEDGNWRFQAGMRARIDFLEELRGEDSAEFVLTDIIGIHADRAVDVALFRMDTFHPDEIATPEALCLASDPSTFSVGNPVYVIGYPAFDLRFDTDEMRRIFGEEYQVKRLQPGEITDLHEINPWFEHDCSTLNGNSGSCVVDLETNQVLGIHFKGNESGENYAVALWKLKDDPLFKEAGLNFGTAQINPA